MIHWSAGFASWDRFTAPSPRERRYGIVDPHTLWAKATFLALGMTDPHCNIYIYVYLYICIYIYVFLHYAYIVYLIYIYIHREPSLAVDIG
jgi:hypothetical protein